MAAGLQVWDASGNIVFDTSDYTFRYMGSYTFTNNPTADVTVSTPGTVAGTYFATCDTGFPVVGTNQVVIKPQFGSGTGTKTLYIFRI